MMNIINERNLEEFKNYIKEGKTINELQDLYSCSRSVITSAKKKYGLVGMSPNSKPRDNGDGTKHCKSCKSNKSINDFYSNGFSPSGEQKYKPNCKSCENEIRNIRNLLNIKSALDSMEKEYACELCGYNKNYAALTFHHIDPKTKEFQISDSKTFSKEKLVVEIKKCMVLCQNCHHEIHNPLHTKEFMG